MEKPILFSTKMVRAILDGRKTQTRRAVNIPEQWKLQGMTHDDLEKSGFWNCWQSSADDPTAGHRWQYGDEWIPRQNYQVGDRLWVRETFGLDKFISPYVDDPDPFYKATEENLDIFPKGFWKPSIFMPKKHARIWLEITDVRIERVQDITEEDAISEGSQIPCDQLPKSCRQGCLSERTQFSRIWDSINGKKYPWSSNPWVWVIEFKRS